MSDPRVSPPPDQITLSEPARVCLPFVDLTRGVGGPRDRQLIYGDTVTVLNRQGDHCLVRAAKDGYCGTLPVSAVTAPLPVTHRVTARATHAYADPDMKSKDLVHLPFGAQLNARAETATFVETEVGHVPRQHLHRSDARATDPAEIASLFLGAPYLWGGNTHLGIDCSGLVQAALLACGFDCPGDSDQQEQQVGTGLSEDAPLVRNDLIFWKGHVALVVEANKLIHANASHMAVVFEPIDEAIARIERQGDGRPTARKRLEVG